MRPLLTFSTNYLVVHNFLGSARNELKNEALHEPGVPKDEQFLNHVRELNQQIYGMIDEEQQKGDC